MTRNYLYSGALAAAGIGAWAVFSAPSETPKTESIAAGGALAVVIVPTALSAEAQLGQRACQTTCVEWHGSNGSGRNGMGPPLIYKIYEPSHHGDKVFQRAVAGGVRAHHWRFGDKPPVKGFTRADVKTVISYLRALQRANGIN